MTEIIAQIPMEGAIALLFTVIGFFLNRFFHRSDKVETNTTAHVTHIALIHEKLGTHASSEQKQWATIDAIMRDIADLKVKVAVLEQREREDR